MKRIVGVILILGLMLAQTAGPAPADEGMWLPNALGQKAMKGFLARRGLKMSPSELWNPNGASLSDAMLMVGRNVGPRPDGNGIQGFGSASFVSSKGLVLTNHHVAYDAVNALSTPERNYIEEGFVASAMKDEAPCPGMALQITTSIEDVTDQVYAAVTPEMTPVEREAALRKASGEVLAAAIKAGKTCDLKEVLFGTRYYLFHFDVLRDVRLVYAPPASIGEYGGDIDNWMWPRHTGDFTYLRAYVSPDGRRTEYDKGNVPFEPKSHLKVSLDGYAPGDFCFIMGHPGTTWRYRTSNSVSYWQDINFPNQIRFLEARKKQMLDETEGDAEKRLAIASDIKSINNTLKNFGGQIEGLKKLDVVARRRAQENALQTWIDADADRRAKYGDILPGITKLYEGVRGDRTPEFMETFGPRISSLRNRLMAAWAEFKKVPLYADANMTLRMTFGSVKAYSPADGINYAYRTTLAGITQKHTGEEPFNAPAKQRDLIAQKDWGRYADKDGAMPCCFLADTDITGGNSGSPIMDAHGRLIGLAFDGNYESMTSDFMFETDITRTISVDIRYVLWCTDKLAGLQRLLDEMEVEGGKS